MGQLIKFRSCQVHIKMLRSFRGRCDKRKVDVGRRRGGQLLLRLLCSLFQSLHCHLVCGQIHTLGALELCQHVIHNLLIEVIAAQTVISCGSQNLDDAVADLDDRYIESTAAQVVYHNLLLFLIIKTISQSCRCRLIDDTLYIQARNLSGILGCLSLRVIEVRRYGDNRFRHFFAQIVLCVAFQLLQNHCGNLLGSVLLSVNGYFIVGSHLSLNGRNGLFRVCNRLTLCRLSYQSFSCLREGYYRRCSSRAFCIGDNHWFTAFHYCYAAVRCSQVDTNNFAHNRDLLIYFLCINLIS